MALSPERYAVLKGYSRVLVRALDEKDAVTCRHCERLIALADAFGRQCQLESGDLRHLRLAAALHDVGKIGIRDAVLRKPGKFDEDEWREMQTHSERGQRIVRAIELEGAHDIGLAIRHHHEDFDGCGYPDRLGGEDIPYMARLVAIIDAYDAMGEPRPYHPRRGHDEIMAVLEDERGGRFDPWLLTQFAAMIDGSPLRVADRG
ncbi:MAG TPA: HD domain-containing phosphohydrolase [Rhodocyclaceae bacterium]